MDPCSVYTAGALKWAPPLKISEAALPRTESSTSRDKQSINDLPKYEVAALFPGYMVTSIDFHPSQPTLLLGMAPFS
ncbi:hypothetical protein KSP39_PZI022351 [Platanthera zijinensis]|uniref:Uncharacterized protein n=1 Tax=Platanthera zijinensis TaxID=2320716 RepID=A0AAP0FUX0_9ASPA